MRTTILSLATLLVLATGTIGLAAVPTAPTAQDLRAQAVRLRTPVATYTDLSPDDAADADLSILAARMSDGLPPQPSDAATIGPGSPILTTIPGEGTFICTANFVYKSGSQYYLGAAGHCFLPEGKKATHGSGADYNAAGVVTQVCVSTCWFGGELTGLLGDFRTLGSVAYARQTGPSGDIGNDFGVVAIPSSLNSRIRPNMPMWDGPTSYNSNEGTGNVLVHYGNGIDAGTFVATKGRAGTSLSDGVFNSWQGNLEINGGDSGSPVLPAATGGTDVTRGDAALGIVTHGLITGAVPLAWGTTIGQCILMAQESNLSLTVVMEGATI